MKRITTLMLLMWSLMLTVPLRGQTGQWTFSGSGFNFSEWTGADGNPKRWSMDMTPTLDGGYVYLASVNVPSQRRLILFKVDANNNIVWVRWYGTTNKLSFGSVATTVDGGFILCGTEERPGGADRNMIVVRVNANGGFVWSRHYGGSSEVEYGHEIISVGGGRYAIVGTSEYVDANCNSPFSLCGHLLVTIIDDNGTVLNSRIYSGPPGREYIRGLSIAQAKSGGYAVTGEIVDSGNDRSAYLLRITDNLSTIWAKEIQMTGSLTENAFFSIKQTSVSTGVGWLLGGYAFQNGQFFQGALAIMDDNGNLNWYKRYPMGSATQQNIYEAIPVPGGFVATGTSFPEALTALKIDPDGQVIWRGRYGTSTAIEIGGTVQYEPVTGGYRFAGTSRPGSTNTRGYVLQVNSQGQSGCDEILDQPQANDVVANLLSWTPPTQPGYNGTSYNFEQPSPALSINPVCVSPCGILALSIAPQGPWCVGDAVTLVSSVNNPGYTYTWYLNTNVVGNTPNLTIPAVSAGTASYTLEITWPGCSLTETIDVTVDPLPVVNAGIDQNICIGNGTQLNANVTGIAPITYSWTPSTGMNPGGNLTLNPFVSPPSTTTYTLTATDANGCASSDAVTINTLPIPNATFTIPAAVCQGEQMTVCIPGNPSGLLYNWSIGNAMPYQTQGIDMNCVTFTADTDPVTVSVEVGANLGCVSQYQADIDVLSCCTNLPAGALVWDNSSMTAEFGGSQVLVNAVIAVSGVFNMDANLICVNCKIEMSENARIDVQPGVLFQMRQGVIEPCTDKMWDGVYILDNSATFSTEDVTIWGGIQAVVSQNGGVFSIVRTLMNRNRVHIKVEPFAGIHTGSLIESDLTCSTGLLAPYLGQRTANAIQVDAVDQLTIGSAASPSAQNLIRNADFGINSQKSGLRVYNNRFEQIDGGSYPFNLLTGRAISAFGNPVSSAVDIIIGGTGNEANVFSDCFQGVDVRNNVNLTVSGNTFENIEYQAIHAQSHLNNTTLIDYNVMNEWGQGIILENMGQSDVTVTWNELFLTSLGAVPGLANVGISLTNGIFPSSAPTLIERNYIDQPLVGIRLGSRNNAMVRLNRVRFNLSDGAITALGQNMRGIEVTRCEGVELRGNLVRRFLSAGTPGASVAPVLVGIRVSRSANSLLRSNTIDNMGYGIEVASVMNGSIIECNRMMRCWAGVNFASASIGDQGSTSVNHGNVFSLIQGPYRLTGAITSGMTNWYYGGSPLYNPNPENVANITTVSGVNQNPCAGGINGRMMEEDADIWASELTESAFTEIRVYPNPSDGRFTISWDGLQDNVSLRVTDLYGKVVLDAGAFSSGNDIDLTHLSKGIYFLQLEALGERNVRKLVVE